MSGVFDPAQILQANQVRKIHLIFIMIYEVNEINEVKITAFKSFSLPIIHVISIKYYVFGTNKSI